ncbi:MAG: flagellar export chaperone FlgN [Spirochaeta sp.]
MQLEHNIAEFQNSLQQQVHLLEELAGYEQRMQHAVIMRDWPELEIAIQEMYALSDCIYSCEHVREKEFARLRSALGLPEDVRFSVVLGNLPQEHRHEIASLYRRLKIAVLRVQTLTGGIDSYVSSTVENMQQIVEEVFPGTRGSIYSRDGNLQGKQPPAMVVNHHL